MTYLYKNSEIDPKLIYKAMTDSKGLKELVNKPIEPVCIMEDEESGVLYLVLGDGSVYGTNSATVRKGIRVMCSLHGDSTPGLKIRVEGRVNERNGREYFFPAYL